MVLATTDLSDAHSDVQIAEPLFRDFGGERAFFGPIATLKLFEDNALVREALESQGEGRVLVVDGAGSLRCALVGGNLAALAEKNGWSGIVVFGAVRDTRELATAKVGVKALAPHPKKSIKKGAGERDVPVTFASVTFNPGAWLYADEDGIIVSESRLDG
ncbi:MAG: ribonuclease E activity regulator RraA [Polyangiales bacterium]